MALKRRKVRFNYHDYCLLPEGDRRELIDGVFYVMAPAPTPRHQSISANLFFQIRQFVRQNALGVILYAPLDVILSDEDVVQPDVLFVAEGRRGIITQRGCEGPPDLVVEVLSPTTAEKDRDLKRKLYASYRVREYWLVDPEAASVQVLSLQEEGYRVLGTYPMDGALSSRVLSGMPLDLSEVFQGV